MKALAVGDLHLGKGEEYGRRPGDRLAQQGAVWARALELSREHDCDAVFFLGDAFETPRPSPQAMLAFERPLVQHLHDDGPPVLAILGNHDVASVSAGTGLEVFHEALLLKLAREPEVHDFYGLMVACLPWTPVSRLVAASNGGDRDAIHRDAAEHLVAIARGLREPRDEPMVLLVHFSISGAVTPDGADVGLFREPVLDAGELEALGFDFVVGGHIHPPQAFIGGGTWSILSSSEGVPGMTNAWGCYVGSPLPLTFGEAKCDHGCWLLDVDGPSVRSTFLPIQSRRFVELAVHPDPAEPMLANDRSVEGAIVKVKIACTEEEARRLDIPAIKRALYAAGAEKVWSVQLEVERAQRARVEGLDEHLDDLQALDLFLAAQGVNGSKAATLRDRLQAYVEEVPV